MQPKNSLVSPVRQEMIVKLLREVLEAGVPGEIWECGVYQGGTAELIAETVADFYRDSPASFSSVPLIRLFDTFCGHPVDDPRGHHRKGMYADTSVEAVSKRLYRFPNILLGIGKIPEIFPASGPRIAFAHIDVDLYTSTRDAIHYIWPRLSRGGILIDDDYDAPGCEGAKIAVDEFFVMGDIEHGPECQVYVRRP